MTIKIKGEVTDLSEISIKEFNVAQINTISEKYDPLRSRSKAPTFALTFLGTHYTLMNNCGFSEEEAKAIEANYHELYKESDAWIADKLRECCKTGYGTGAFGLRIRTPLLAKTILNNSATPYMSSAEARSVGNALSGQSYGLLTNRAAIAFMEKVWTSEYRYDIFPVMLIHDAIYLHIKDDVDVLKFVNDNLIEEMAWQDLPEIQHDIVGLEANLDVFYGGWHQPITLSNDISTDEILSEIKAGMLKYKT